MKINEKHLCAFANSSAPIDHEGYLLKRGDLNKAYQRRWFVLKGNLLFYFEKKGDKEPVGVIILEGCTVELSESIDAFAFQICFEGAQSRAYVLAAETQEKMEKWMKVVTCAGYDYMKLMISELQRQVDELNLTEQQKLMAVPQQTQHDLVTDNDSIKQILRNSQAKSDSSESDFLVDLSLSTESLSNQSKRQGRVNPFNDKTSKQNKDPFISAPSVCLSSNSRKVRDFEAIHAEYGLYIQQKVMDNLT